MLNDTTMVTTSWKIWYKEGVYVKTALFIGTQKELADIMEAYEHIVEVRRIYD